MGGGVWGGPQPLRGPPPRLDGSVSLTATDFRIWHSLPVPDLILTCSPHSLPEGACGHLSQVTFLRSASWLPPHWQEKAVLASPTEGPQERPLPLTCLRSPRALSDSLPTVLPTLAFWLFLKAHSTSGPLHGFSLPESPAPTHLLVSSPERPIPTPLTSRLHPVAPNFCKAYTSI